MTVTLLRAPFGIGVIGLLACAVLAVGDSQTTMITARARPPVSRPDFRLESDLVLIPVNVTDARNHAVTDLRREAFRIFEDRNEQQVVEFTREDAPLSVGIIFDSSYSMTGKLEKSREAIKQFLHFANPDDEFFLVEFASRAGLTVPFTTDPGEIQSRLLAAEPKGHTALLDAVCRHRDAQARPLFAARPDGALRWRRQQQPVQ